MVDILSGALKTSFNIIRVNQIIKRKSKQLTLVVIEQGVDCEITNKKKHKR